MFSLLLGLAAVAPVAVGAPLTTAAPASPAPAAATPLVEPDASRMNQRDIRAFNAALPRTHPFYIRCVSTIETGSLVKRAHVCRTNHQWARAEEEGNRNARESVEGIQSRGSTNETAEGAAP